MRGVVRYMFVANTDCRRKAAVEFRRIRTSRQINQIVNLTSSGSAVIDFVEVIKPVPQDSLFVQAIFKIIERCGKSVHCGASHLCRFLVPLLRFLTFLDKLLYIYPFVNLRQILRSRVKRCAFIFL